MSSKHSSLYTLKYISSLKNSSNIPKLPEDTIEKIEIINEQLSKHFKFLLEKKHNNRRRYSDKDWRNAKEKRKKLFSKNDDQESQENIQRKINSLLNKINLSNYEDIKNKIVIICSKNVILEYTINQMFTKAVFEHGICNCYVKLYQDLISSKDTSHDFIVSNVISEKCDNYLNIFLKKNNELEDQDHILSDYDKLCLENKQTDYIKGYSQFIGELHNNNIININKIQRFLSSILQNIEENKKEKENRKFIENNIDSLFIIINCIGKKIKEINNYNDSVRIFQQLKKDKYLTSKAKFKIMDTIDLLNNY